MRASLPVAHPLAPVRPLVRLVAAACLALTCSAPALAQPRPAGDDFPSRPIRYVIPFAPGGGNDVVGRIVAQHMAEQLGVSVVADNRGGAGGAIGSEIVARASPDGYTLIMAGVGSHAVNPNLHAKLGYDPQKSFESISMLAIGPFILIVTPGLPARTTAELITLAKAKPGQINYASAGVGSSAHLVVELFRSQAGINITHVPYKGTGPALTDLIGGQVQLQFGTMGPSLPHVRAGRVRALGVSSGKRSPAAPDVPTIAESGLPGFEAVTWYGLMAPAGTPRPIVDRLNKAVVAALKQQSLIDALALQGNTPAPSTAREFAEFVRAEGARYGKLIKEIGLKGS